MPAFLRSSRPWDPHTGHSGTRSCLISPGRFQPSEFVRATLMGPEWREGLTLPRALPAGSCRALLVLKTVGRLALSAFPVLASNGQITSNGPGSVIHRGAIAP